MSDTIIDAKDLPASASAGNGNGRFQVMIRLEKGLPQQAIDALARLQGGRLEKAIIEQGWQLEVDKGNVIVLSFPDTPARDNIIAALSRRPGVQIAELDAMVRAQLVSTDTHYGNGNLWGMYGPSGDGIGAFNNVFGTHADVAWARSDISADSKVGSMRTVVGVIDSGVDPLHPDLYLNIWINQREIPAGLATDQDSDGIITFRDLNVQVSGNYVNAVSDVNGNGRIDADDILQLPAWANGADNDANGYTDDLFGWDFRNNDNRPFESYDTTGTNGNPADSYHGTHVSGTIGALANGAGVAGVVWDAQILPMRFLGSDGTGNTSDAIAALYYFTSLGQANPTLEFVGTNNSWGGSGASSLLADAIQTAGNNGHLFFAAAGNDGTNNDSLPHYPSNYAISSTFQGVAYDPVISVASITSTGARSSFSNYGVNSVDIAAPGSIIASTLAGNEWTGSYTYANLSGTSMATPHVTGAAALIASEYPGLHPADLKAAILNGGVATASVAGITVTGDRLNIPGAIDLVGPSPVITHADPVLSLEDTSEIFTITFPEAVTGFTLSDVSVTPGHGTLSDLTTTDNISWTVQLTLPVVETNAARILVGNRYTTALGDYGREGQSAPFMIDRIAPTITVPTIVATKDGTGVDVDGTLSAALAQGDLVRVYRGGTMLGNASVTGTNWHYDDTTALADGTYQYTARVADDATNNGPLSGNGTLVISTLMPAPAVVVNDALVNLADASAGVTITFSEAVTGFDLADLSVSPGHGSVSNLATSDNIVWTATFTPANVETQAAKIMVGTGYSSQVGGKSATAGESALFAIDRIAPTITVRTIVATRDGTGANIDGTVNAALGPGDVVKVYRGSTLLGNATATGSNWHYDDTAPLANGIHQYTARVADAAANNGALSSKGMLVFPDPDFSLALGAVQTGSYGKGFNGTNDTDGRITAQFQGTSQKLTLSLTGYDIDWSTEVRVLLNGAQIGNLAVTPDNGTSTSQFTILASQQLAGNNVLTFINGNASYVWGMTDIILQPAVQSDFALPLGATNTGSFGKGLNGANDADGSVTGRFAGTDQDLRLGLTGFDIDWSTEVRVLLNGTQIGNLAVTPDNGTGHSEFTILASQQLAGNNVLTFINNSSTYLWGITDILLAPIV